MKITTKQQQLIKYTKSLTKEELIKLEIKIWEHLQQIIQDRKIIQQELKIRNKKINN